MSDLMTSAVIGMPYEMAMADELSRRQFYDRAQDVHAELRGLKKALQEIADRGGADGVVDGQIVEWDGTACAGMARRALAEPRKFGKPLAP